MTPDMHGSGGARSTPSSSSQVVPARGTREAEMAKLLENTYRHVNIALVNEMVQFCHELDIDLWNVIELARTKPFGFQAFYPGPGVGGHCIPIDPNYLSHRVEQQLGHPFRFVELAQEINASMPSYVAQRAQNLLNDNRRAINGSTVLLLGVTYKANIADGRESPATPLAQRLLRLGAEVALSRSLSSSYWSVPGTRRVTDLMTEVPAADLVILVQHHRAYDVVALQAAARAVPRHPRGHPQRRPAHDLSGPDRPLLVTRSAGRSPANRRPRRRCPASVRLMAG